MGHKLYNILNIKKDASNDEIKKAFRKLAVENHPDKGGDKEKFQEISNAYNILSDSDKRQKYDMLGDDNFQDNDNGHAFNPSDLFEQLFGNGIFKNHQNENKCKDVCHIVQLSNKDAYFGGNKIIKVKLIKKCNKCVEMCRVCQGKGMVNEIQRMGPFTNMFTKTCDNCNGNRKINKKGQTNCSICKGTTEIINEKTIDLIIPPGVNTGHKTVFKELGEQPDIGNQIAGDLIFEFLVIKDNIFERNDLDLIYKVNITFLESLVGKDIKIPLYSGEYSININIFGIIEPNKEYKIKKKGMKNSKKEGDLIIIFKINYPEIKIDKEYIKEISDMINKYLVK